MTHYSLDDPRLQQAIEEIAAETAATWPVTDEMLNRLGPLLNPPTTTPVVRPAMPERRAA